MVSWNGGVYNGVSAGEGEPVKMFERTANLNGNQIINYRADPSGKWLVLIGIAPGAPEVRAERSRALVLLQTSVPKDHKEQKREKACNDTVKRQNRAMNGTQTQTRAPRPQGPASGRPESKAPSKWVAEFKGPREWETRSQRAQRVGSRFHRPIHLPLSVCVV